MAVRNTFHCETFTGCILLEDKSEELQSIKKELGKQSSWILALKLENGPNYYIEASNETEYLDWSCHISMLLESANARRVQANVETDATQKLRESITPSQESSHSSVVTEEEEKDEEFDPSQAMDTEKVKRVAIKKFNKKPKEVWSHW